jgi:hypothetical protein
VVQRLFAMFPQGGPGLALVLLRGSILATLFTVARPYASVVYGPLPQVGFVLVSLCVALGFLTPVMAVTAAAAAVVDMLGGAPAQGFWVSGALLLDASALGLLGPGAYSVDARLFGRRVTVLPAPTGTE